MTLKEEQLKFGASIMDTDMDMESSAVDQDQDRTKTIINTNVIISTITLSGRV